MIQIAPYGRPSCHSWMPPSPPGALRAPVSSSDTLPVTGSVLGDLPGQADCWSSPLPAGKIRHRAWWPSPKLPLTVRGERGATAELYPQGQRLWGLSRHLRRGRPPGARTSHSPRWLPPAPSRLLDPATRSFTCNVSDPPQPPSGEKTQCSEKWSSRFTPGVSGSLGFKLRSPGQFPVGRVACGSASPGDDTCHLLSSRLLQAGCLLPSDVW